MATNLSVSYKLHLDYRHMKVLNVVVFGFDPILVKVKNYEVNTTGFNAS